MGPCNHNSLESASEEAFRLLPQVAWIGLNVIAQLKKLNSDIQMLGCNAAACMIALAQTENHNRQHHLGRAIELLDQGRSILWSQTSNFKQDLEDLQRVDSKLASDLDDVGKFLRKVASVTQKTLSQKPMLSYIVGMLRNVKSLLIAFAVFQVFVTSHFPCPFLRFKQPQLRVQW